MAFLRQCLIELRLQKSGDLIAENMIWEPLDEASASAPSPPTKHLRVDHDRSSFDFFSIAPISGEPIRSHL